MQDRTYPRRVADDDGTSHTYTTLERPNLHFDSTGQLTHINLAADLVTGDEGCADLEEISRGCTRCRLHRTARRTRPCQSG